MTSTRHFIELRGICSRPAHLTRCLCRPFGRESERAHELRACVSPTPSSSAPSHCGFKRPASGSRSMRAAASVRRNFRDRQRDPVAFDRQPIGVGPSDPVPMRREEHVFVTNGFALDALAVRIWFAFGSDTSRSWVVNESLVDKNRSPKLAGASRNDQRESENDQTKDGKERLQDRLRAGKWMPST